MEGDNKHLQNFVGGHRLSHDLCASLWLHLVNWFVETLLIVISQPSANAT